MNLSKEAGRERAAAYYKRALALSYRVQPRDEGMIAQLYSRLNSYYFEKNEPQAMEPWYTQKISVDQAAYGPDAPILVDDYLALARVYRQARQMDLCEKTINQAIVVAQKGGAGNSTGEASKTSLEALPLFKAKAALAAINADRGVMEAALKLNQEALALFDQLSPEQKQQSEISEFFMRYASLLDRLGKQDQAQLLKVNHKAYFAS
jgi:hypothetical protein